MASINSGPMLSLSGPATSLGSIANLPQTKQLVVTQALDGFFHKNWLDICTLDSIMKIMGTSTQRNPAYEQLHALHCVHWNTMRPEVRDIIPQLVREAITHNNTQCLATQEVMQGIHFN